jgi:hypothetical protein
VAGSLSRQLSANSGQHSAISPHLRQGFGGKQESNSGGIRFVHFREFFLLCLSFVMKLIRLDIRFLCQLNRQQDTNILCIIEGWRKKVKGILS